LDSGRVRAGELSVTLFDIDGTLTHSGEAPTEELPM
jgi:hypothetical protein